MKEEHRPIKNYENLYDITASGRVFSYSRNKYLARKKDEYGFHIVKLSKKGISSNYNVFQLWKEAFFDLGEEEFRGARKVKYK